MGKKAATNQRAEDFAAWLASEGPRLTVLRGGAVKFRAPRSMQGIAPRRRHYRVTLWFDEAQYVELLERLQRSGCTSMQAFVALVLALRKRAAGRLRAV